MRLGVNTALRKILTRLRRNERGTAVVEFALVAPLLFLLMFGIIDFARLLAYYNTLTQLSSQGARAAVVDRMPDGTVIPVGNPSALQQQLVSKYTGPGEIRNASSFRVCISQVPSAVGQPVTVKTSFTFNFIPFIGRASSALGGTKTLHASSTERAEVVPLDSNGNPALGYGQVDQNGQPC